MATIEIYIKGTERDHVERRGEDRYEIFAFVRDINTEDGRRRVIDLVNQQRRRDGRPLLAYDAVRKELQSLRVGSSIKFNYT